MALVRPFRALRYALPPSGLSRVLCPPYDIIPPGQAAKLRKEPRNAIHLELPAGDSAHLPAGARYKETRKLWDRWLRDGVLAHDPEPALYLCEQRFNHGGRDYRRLGVFVDLSLFKSKVVPHERTFSKPKADRLKLIKALQVNTSPIFGLFQDPAGRLLAAFREQTSQAPLAEGKDPAGGKVRLWSLGAASGLRRALLSRPLLIADGHHRFQVSLDYAKSLGRDVGIMAYLCSDADPGLLLLPTHRVLKPGAALLKRLSAGCRLTAMPGRAALEGALGKGGGRLGFFLNKERWLAQPRTAPHPPAPSREREGGLLPVEWLAEALEQAGKYELVAYPHEAAEAEAVAQKHGALAVLLPAPSVAQLRAAVAARGLMPQKSTYFFPKVPTGLVFRELRNA